MFETIAGELPEFDKEFEVSDDTEYPQFYLFTDGNRLPRYYENSESLVRLVVLFKSSRLIG